MARMMLSREIRLLVAQTVSSEMPAPIAKPCATLETGTANWSPRFSSVESKIRAATATTILATPMPARAPSAAPTTE